MQFNDISFLVNIPFFKRFTQIQLEEFSLLLSQKQFKKNEIIVTENELIGELYLIVEGRAEVSHEVDKKHVILSVLNPYDAIGLSDVSIYSTTGLRTATVTAITPMETAVIGINEFQQFIASHELSKEDLKKNIDLITKINFIKKSEPFHSLSPQELIQLSNDIEVQQVDQGTIIIKQGEISDQCYFIQAGRVEVLKTDKDKKENVINILDLGEIFGERALLTLEPRNSTIRALTQCELLVLSKYQFLKILKNNVGTYQEIISTQLNRSCPIQNPDVVAYHQKSASGEDIIILKDMQKSRYFQLTQTGWEVWKQLDGAHSVQEIIMEIFSKTYNYCSEEIIQLVASLCASGFLEINLGTVLNTDKHNINNFKKYFEYKYSFKNANLIISKLYNAGGYLLFNRYIQIIFAILAVFGIATFVKLTKIILPLFQPFNALAWLLLFLSFAISTILHELAHGFTTKKFNRQVNGMGIGLNWGLPYAFVDTSDMWLSSPKERILVNLAGVYIQAVLCGILCLVSLAIIHSYTILAQFFWATALFNYIVIVLNLNSIIELDGYYIFMDVIKLPNLRASSILFLSIIPQLFIRPYLAKLYWKQILFWIISIGMLLLTLTLYFVLHNSVFSGSITQHSHAHTHHLNWIIPSLILLFPILKVWVDNRKIRDNNANNS